MEQKEIFKAVLAMAIALAFIMPVTAFANNEKINIQPIASNEDRNILPESEKRFCIMII
ncbi:unnamed protein product [marine sediment metagenome]|uniref:Uncharacterized protein n=1 Tax=marine sediment metagenome TaxID=412755 RepID=X1GD18_9ZZZZ